MNLQNACAHFLESCRRERQLAANTLAAYRQDLAEFSRFFPDRAIAGIGGEELVGYAQHLRSERKLAPATVKRRLACLKAMFGRLRRQGVVRETPFAGIDLCIRLPQRLPRCLQGEEARGLLQAAESAGATARLAALLLFATGMRIGELAAVRIEDIDLEQRSIRIFGKGSRERQVFLPNHGIAAAVREYVAARPSDADGAAAEQGLQARAGRLLVNARGRPASAACLRAHIKALGRKAGLGRRITPHMLRHTAATALMEAGVDIRLVQRLLGHQSISTTQIYTHVSDRTLKAAIVAANVLRLGEGRGVD